MAAESDDDILDGLFHGCALLAYLEQAAAERGWPDSTATQRRAYRHYQDAIDEKNRRKSRPEPVDAGSRAGEPLTPPDSPASRP